MPATSASGTSKREIEGQQLDDQRRADLGAAHGELAGDAADDARTREGADEQRHGGRALEGDGERRAGQHRHDRIAHGGAQPVAQHVAIGALDAGAHHAGRKQHQRDRAGQMQQHDRAAHGSIRRRHASAGAQIAPLGQRVLLRIDDIERPTIS